MVRALASHQCVPGSIPGPDVICGLSLLLVLFPAPRTITSKFNSSLESVLDLWISAKALDTFDTQVKGCLLFFLSIFAILASVLLSSLAVVKM